MTCQLVARFGSAQRYTALEPLSSLPLAAGHVSPTSVCNPPRRSRMPFDLIVSAHHCSCCDGATKKALQVKMQVSESMPELSAEREIHTRKI